MRRNALPLVLALGLACLMEVGAASAARLTFELRELPPDRTSMEYGPQINQFSEKVLGHKWVSDKGYGFVFYEKENLQRHDQYAERYIKDGYFFEIHKYLYRQKLREYGNGLFARQSNRVGFIEFTDTGDQRLHFRLIDDDTLEYVVSANTRSSQDRLILKRVDEFPDNPNPVRLKSARERGTIY